MNKLIKFIKPYTFFVIAAPLLMIIEVATELILPRIMSDVIDTGVAAHNTSYILTRGVIMILIAILGVIGGVGCTICASKASVGFGTDIRTEMLKKIGSFSFVNLDKFHTSSLVTRLTNDITQIQQIVLMSLRMLVRAPFTFIGGLVMAFSINFSLTLNLVVAIIILAITITFLVKFTFPLFKLVQEKVDNVNIIMRENLSGVRVIKAFVRADKEKRKFEAKNTELRDTTISAFRIVTLMIPIMMIVMNFVTVIIIWKGGNLVYNGKMITGDLMAYLTYVTQILISFMMVGMVFMQLTRGKASIERINEVLDTELDIIEIAKPNTTAITKGKITFNNVTFTYPNSTGDPVLENINLTINSGETVGILGETGAGKSTLVNLIPRLYDVTKGNIYIDNVDIKDMSKSHLRSNIGIVLQKATLFSGTVKDNILWGKKDATNEEILKACSDAQALEFINEMPKKLDTYVEQAGVNLSGGQKQRISIARTLIKKPKILIFDDSTSALDTGTEAKIQQALKTNYQNSTKIIIAQKITSVMQADKIIVINSGQITAEGNHDYLLKNCLAYQEIYNSQLKKEEN